MVSRAVEDAGGELIGQRTAFSWPSAVCAPYQLQTGLPSDPPPAPAPCLVFAAHHYCICRQKWPDGLHEFQPRRGGVGRYTDDTQVRLGSAAVQPSRPVCGQAAIPAHATSLPATACSSWTQLSSTAVCGAMPVIGLMLQPPLPAALLPRLPQMTIALARSLVRKGRCDPADCAQVGLLALGWLRISTACTLWTHCRCCTSAGGAAAAAAAAAAHKVLHGTVCRHTWRSGSWWSATDTAGPPEGAPSLPLHLASALGHAPAAAMAAGRSVKACAACACPCPCPAAASRGAACCSCAHHHPLPQCPAACWMRWQMAVLITEPLEAWPGPLVAPWAMAASCASPQWGWPTGRQSPPGRLELGRPAACCSAAGGCPVAG